MTIRRLEALFVPASLALVGASARPGSLGHAVLANLLKGGFAGQIDLVNPRYAQIEGRACVASLSDFGLVP